MKTILLSLLLAVTPLFTPAHGCGAYEGVDEPLFAHEWGTFTSVQGADGILMPWNPYLISELPAFVYDRTRPVGSPELRSALAIVSDFGKYNLSTVQRMETPVIYFYSNVERLVDVSVKFPLGLVTEWYPQAKKFGPARLSSVGTTPRADSFIDWSRVKILPARANATLAATLPVDKSGSHYFAARATDAALVQVTEGPVPGQKPEVEKFLFYRGLGQFPSPLKVSLDEREQIVLENVSGHVIAHAFVFSLRNGQGEFQALENVTAGRLGVSRVDTEQRRLSKSELTDQMSLAMEKALIAEGLFPKEAAAMVATWRDSWFAEEGLRVFYLVPRPVTDSILPLNITPQPTKTARVFVGRAEVITPAVERHLREQITRFGSGSPAARDLAIAEGRNLKLGRFAAAAVSRTVGKDASKEFTDQAWKYFQALSTPAEAPKTASLR
jgi:hypothetical protein